MGRIGESGQDTEKNATDWQYGEEREREREEESDRRVDALRKKVKKHRTRVKRGKGKEDR